MLALIRLLLNTKKEIKSSIPTKMGRKFLFLVKSIKLFGFFIKKSRILPYKKNKKPKKDRIIAPSLFSIKNTLIQKKNEVRIKKINKTKNIVLKLTSLIFIEAIDKI
tara:strand:- start:1988 stop:2308 length:321 start_codon:yes stop_codon:yes gene_type:complete